MIYIENNLSPLEVRRWKIGSSLETRSSGYELKYLQLSVICLVNVSTINWSMPISVLSLTSRSTRTQKKPMINALPVTANISLVIVSIYHSLQRPLRMKYLTSYHSCVAKLFLKYYGTRSWISKLFQRPPQEFSTRRYYTLPGGEVNARGAFMKGRQAYANRLGLSTTN